MTENGSALSEQMVLLYDHEAQRRRSLIVNISTHLVGKLDDAKGGVWHVSIPYCLCYFCFANLV